MSEENLAQDNAELVRRAMAAFGARDVAAFLELMDPAVEWHPLTSVWQREYRGHDGIRQWLADVDELWEDFRVEADEVIPAGARVFGAGRIAARSKESGVELELPTAWVVLIEGGKAVRVDFYLDRAEALAAAGLPDQP